MSDFPYSIPRQFSELINEGEATAACKTKRKKVKNVLKIRTINMHMHCQIIVKKNKGIKPPITASIGLEYPSTWLKRSDRLDAR